MTNNNNGHEASNEEQQIKDIDNALENFKSDILQVVRQEIIQNLKTSKQWKLGLLVKLATFV